MELRWIILIIIFLQNVYSLPPNFVFLRDVDPTIQQEIRYAGSYNFIGKPLQGYLAAECILTEPAAQALARVQKKLRKFSLSLKVYDCYRPTDAVAEMLAWSEQSSRQEMKAAFYPRINKGELFQKGYIAYKSGHSRGSTVDLTIVQIADDLEIVKSGEQLKSCISISHFKDNSIEMGTGYDCLDETAFINAMPLNSPANHNRWFLRYILKSAGFEPYDKEWWHFTLSNEPYAQQYFNFYITHEAK